VNANNTTDPTFSQPSSEESGPSYGDPASWKPLLHPGLRLRYVTGGRLRAEVPQRGVSIPAPPEVQELFAACDGERSAAEVAAALTQPTELSAPGRVTTGLALLTTLRRQGVLKPVPERPAEASEGYAHPSIHRVMIGDRVRTDAFQQALQAQVQEGDVVVDVGAGTGVLSLFSAQAGAKQVYAIERSRLAKHTKSLIEHNGVSDRIEVLCGEAAELCAERELECDLLVSEWLGQFVLTEGMFPAVAAARDAWLRPGGTLIPAGFELFLAPLGAARAGNETLEPDTPAYWSQPDYGVSFDPLLEVELDVLHHSIPAPITGDRLLAPPQSAHVVDCRMASPDDLYFKTELEFRTTRAGTLAGFAGHFTSDLGGGVILDTSPEGPQTHWEQHLFFLRPVRLEEGALLKLSFEARRAKSQDHTPIYELKWEGPGGAGGSRIYNADYE
jgi:type I protein arginine methyltransferase